MSNGNIVPASVYSAMPNSDSLSMLGVGSETYGPQGIDQNTAAIWLSVYDLTSLKQVASEVSTDGQTVPSDISQYAGNSQYFLFAVSSNAWASVMPQGDLYALLQKVGAGSGLLFLEQIVGQFGTGFFGTFTYILGAAMDDSVQGFEAASFTESSLMVMGFLPVEVDGNTIYAPVQAGA